MMGGIEDFGFPSRNQYTQETNGVSHFGIPLHGKAFLRHPVAWPIGDIKIMCIHVFIDSKYQNNDVNGKLFQTYSDNLSKCL